MRVTVLTGGTSAERDVAIASAVQVIAALRSRGHEVAVVDTARGYIPERDEPSLLSGGVGTVPPSSEQLQALEQGLLLSGLANLRVVRDADVLFLALHGGRGEDGTLQTLLEMVGVPYTGSGRLGSAMAMDKDVSKRLFRMAGVPTADWVMAPAQRDRIARDFGWPVVVKPSKQGSTVGLTVVKRGEEYDEAVTLARRYDDEVMVERFVPGRELTVGVLDGAPLAVGERHVAGLVWRDRKREAAQRCLHRIDAAGLAADCRKPQVLGACDPFLKPRQGAHHLVARTVDLASLERGGMRG